MDLNFVFFELGPTLKLIFKLSYIPKIEDFKELTASQYDAFHAQATEEEINSIDNCRILALIPDDPAIYQRVMEVSGNNLYVITENQLAIFIKTSDIINHLVEISGREDLDTVPKKLAYIASIFPDVFSEGTPYNSPSLIENVE